MFRPIYYMSTKNFTKEELEEKKRFYSDLGFVVVIIDENSESTKATQTA